MGLVHAEITLKNLKDKMKVEEGYIKEPEVRQTTVKAVVDTGAMTLIDNMDLMVDPCSQMLVGAHGDEEVGLLL